MDSQAETDVAKLAQIAFRMALKWCHSHADAEDISQEAMIRYVGLTAKPRNPVAWLYVVVRRLSHRSYRRSLARCEAEAQFLSASRHLPRSHVDTFIEINMVLSRLPEHQRRLIVLLIGGAQSREIAETLGVKVRDVGQMVSRARRVARNARNGQMTEVRQKSRR
jgi:RNA polymerase sigma factor (sigma-70 family)